METKRRIGLIRLGIICLVCLGLIFSAFYAKPITYADVGIPFVIDKNPIENVTIFSDSITAKLERGQSVRLSVEVSPTNAEKTLVETSYEIIKGKKYASVKDGDTLEVSTSAPIGEVIEVKAVVDGVESENVLRFEIVETPVSYIEITNEETEIVLGSLFRLETKIFPENATNQAVIYSVTSGSEYVHIGYGGFVRFKKTEIPDDLTVTFEAKSVDNPSAVAEKTFSVKKSVFDVIIDATFELSEVETMRTYSFNTEAYKNYFGGKDVEYNIDVDENTATIDSEGLLYIKPTATVGKTITVTITSDDVVEPYEQKLIVVDVYPKTIAASIVTEPSIVHENVAYYLAGDEIELEAVLGPINTSEKAFGFEVSDDTLATVDGNKVKIADNITAENTSFEICAYTPYYNDQHPLLRSDRLVINIYVPATAVAVEKNTHGINNRKSNQNAIELEEGNRYDISELMRVSVLPSNNSACNQKYKLCNDSLAYASIAEKSNGNDELIIKGNLPAGVIKVGVYVETETYNANGEYLTVKSAPLYFDVYKPTQFIELTLLTENPYSAENDASVVYMEVSLSAAASINMPSFEIVQGEELIDGDIVYENSVLSFKLKRSNELGVYKPIKIIATQDGVESKEISIDYVIPDEELELLPDRVDRGSRYAFSVKHTFNTTNNEIEWRVSDASRLLGVSKVNTASDTFYIPRNLCADTEITIEYRSAEKVFFGNNAPWKTAVYTVKKLNANTENIERVYNNSPTLSDGFNVVYDKDNNYVSGVGYVDINGNNPQLMAGHSTTVTLKYGASGAVLTDYGLKIIGVNIVGDATGCVGTDNTFSITINNGAIGNTNVEISVDVSDGNNKYTVDCGKLQVFRQLSKDGTLNFRTMTANNTNIRNLIDLVAWKNSVNKNASEYLSNGFKNFTFKIGSTSSGASIDNNIVTVNSYTASKEQYIQYSCAEYYNGKKISTYEGTGYLPLDYVDVDNNGGSGALSHLIILDDFKYDLKAEDLPKRDYYVFCGYTNNNEHHYIKYFDPEGKRINYGSYSGPAVAGWREVRVILDIYQYCESMEYIESYGVYYSETTETIKAKSIDGWDFVRWAIITNAYETLSENKAIKIKGSDVYITDGGHRMIVAIYKKSCVASGTQITLADGSMVPVEDLKGDEQLLVWNIYTGTFDTAPILFVDYHGIHTYEIIRLTFDNGNYVEVIDNHGFFDVDMKKYIFIDKHNAKDYIGHTYITESGESKLISVEIEQKETGAYSPITFGHFCYYVNGLLSMPANTEPFINIFDIDTELMRIDEESYAADVEQYGLYTYATFIEDWSKYLSGVGQAIEAEQLQAMLPEIMYEAFSGQFLKISIGKGNTNWETLTKLINTYAEQLTGGNE